MGNALLEALILLGENSYRTLGLEVLNFRNLRLTGISLFVCRFSSFTTDSLRSVGGVFLKMKLLTLLH